MTRGAAHVVTFGVHVMRLGRTRFCSVIAAIKAQVGVPKDEAEAVKWYRKAADSGNFAARRELDSRMKSFRSW